jgi:hypothetical protein
MKAVFETIGILIVSWFLMAIPILCTLSFVYNWFSFFKFILIVACCIELFGFVALLYALSQYTE